MSLSVSTGSDHIERQEEIKFYDTLKAHHKIGLNPFAGVYQSTI